ncbi:NAD-dependent epimerase/dehydratase family protein [Streptomyces sp. NPDC090127]|uniref:NAD-dependent epimerase/dehydratase family protein n=1 Tax=Streptomyces sp. NPDC090127 TaxID=3365953 RepID=UPI00382C9882
MTAVVLGGSGFLGQHIAAELRSTGRRVVSVSRTGDAGIDLTADEGQHRFAELLAAERATLVVNAAGRAWRATEEDMVRGNAELVERLVAAVLAVPARPRLVQLGSVHEYGPGTRGTSTPEDHAAAPVTPYGRTKLRATESVARACADSGLEAVVLRVANVAGPGAPVGSLLRTVADQLVDVASGALSELRYGPLRAERDFVDVRDVADAVLAAADAPSEAVGGHVINIGRGEAVRARYLVDRLIALSGLAVPVVEETATTGATARSDVEWQQLDIAKAHRVLGWKPARDLDTSLRDLLLSR